MHPPSSGSRVTWCCVSVFFGSVVLATTMAMATSSTSSSVDDAATAATDVVELVDDSMNLVDTGDDDFVAAIEPNNAATPVNSASPSPSSSPACHNDNYNCSCDSGSDSESQHQNPKQPICLSEECVLAAATVLSSLDKSVDPCDDFYQYSCGGWIKNRLSMNTDRFSVVDRRNQKTIGDFLSERPESLFDADDVSAETKARRFFHSCMADQPDQDKRNLFNLQAVINFAGGWNLTSNYNASMTFDERVNAIQNSIGVNVFFSWGVLEQNGAHRLAIIAGGWNDVMIVEQGDKKEYQKLMSLYTILLAQAVDEQVVVEYRDEMDLDDVDIDVEDSGANATLSESADDSNGHDNSSSNRSSADNDSDDFNDNAELVIETVDVVNVSTSDEQTAVKNNISDFSTAVGDNVTVDGLSVRASAEKLADADDQDYQSDQGRRVLYGENISHILERNSQIEKVMSRVVAFENKLAAIAPMPKGPGNFNLKTKTLSQLAAEYPFLNWRAFFRKAFEEKPEVQMTEETEILVQVEFLEGINKLIHEYQSTQQGRETLINYMIWRLMASFYPDRPDNLESRHEHCLKTTEVNFPPALTALYIKAKGVSQSEATVAMVDNIVVAMKTAFKRNLPNVHWMTPASLKAAEAKLEKMVDLIGYPQRVLNSTWLDSVYSSVDVSAEDFLVNMVSVSAFRRRCEIDLLLRPYVRGQWNDFTNLESIATVNAYYNQVSNTMVVPIGMLQPPLFWNKPKSLTFGAFGIIVAHEITHAFDDVGIKYDPLGARRSLYDEKTVDAFHEASDCVRQQYFNFSHYGFKVDGNVTLAENIADHGGLKLAEMAYEDYWERTGSDSHLPAVSLTHEQLFYVGYALPWCAIHSDMLVRYQVFRDEHAPDRFRVLGPLANSPGFARAFNCPKNSRMNPESKCKIW